MRLEASRPVPQREVTWKQSCLLAIPNALGSSAIKAVEQTKVKILGKIKPESGIIKTPLQPALR